MSLLTVVRGPGKGSSIALAPDRAVTIGAGMEAALRVPGREVADAHLVVKSLKDGGFGAKGLAGPFVHNGRKVAAARLSDGDVIEVGDSAIRYAEAPSGAARLPEQIGGFRILGVLGEGGMGRVFRAEQTSLGREVALKVLSKERTSDPMFVGRFVAEARAAARLNHPNVVQVFDVDHDGETYYYSMELMHGGSAEDLLKSRGKLPVEEAAPIVLAAARALAFAEQMRVVHRDIKPDNLMVDRHGHVKVADLGLALTEDDEHGKAVGTPHFMSPEQVRHEKVDHRSDIYSLGCTFYRLVTGRTPFSGASVREILTAHLKQEPMRADEVDPTIPSGVADVIERAIEKDPDERFQSAQELAEALESAMAPPVRRAWWIAAGVVGIVAVVLAIVLWPKGDPSEPRTIREVVVDPEAQRAIQENARLAAENALLEVRTRGLDGEPLAAALDAMAEAHPGTNAAEEARADAARIRAAIEREAREAEARRAAVDAARTRLREEFRDALGRDDLTAAHAVLSAESVDDDLRRDAAIVQELDTLRTELERAASTHVAALRQAVDDALAAEDPASARQRLAPLAALVAPDSGWPETLLPDRAALHEELETWRGRIDALEQARDAAAETAAWERLSEAMTAADGPVAELRALRPAAAVTSARALSDELAGRAAADAIAALIPAFEHAETYLARYVAAAERGEVEVVLTTGERAHVLGLAAASATRGLRVQPADGSDERVVPLDQVVGDAARYFPEPREPDVEHAALIGSLAWAQHLLAAEAYLAELSREDDSTGTSEAAYDALTVGLDDAIAEVQADEKEWTGPFATELAAARLLARSLRALSDRRNRSAATFAERLLREHPDSLIVRMLR